MKKLITLMLLVVGFVGQAKAWDTVYLFYKGNSYSGIADSFNKIDDNNFYYIVPKNSSFCDSDDFYFRFNVKWYDNGEKWKEYGPSTNNQLITEGGFAQANDNINTSNSYRIASNGASNYYRINLSYKDVSGTWMWVVSVTYSELFSITYIDEANWSWGEVHFYPFQGSFKTCNVDWPGTAVTLSDGSYSATVEGFSEGKIQFNDGTDNNKHEKDIVNNGVYRSYSSSIDLYAIKANISSVGYATFSSTKAVDLSSETTIQACTAKVGVDGKITYTAVENNTSDIDGGTIASPKYVAANEGVLLRRADGIINMATSIIPLHATQSVKKHGNNDFVCITTKQKLSQTDGGNTNYILTNQKSDNTIGPLGFYKVNSSGSWCAAGTAYLQTTVNATRDYFPLDDESASVESIVNETKNANLPVYDLQGRYVENPQKGLYIMDGRKVVIK